MSNHLLTHIFGFAFCLGARLTASEPCMVGIVYRVDFSQLLDEFPKDKTKIETEHLAIRALDPNIVRGESARGHLYYSIQEVQQLCKLAFGCTNLVLPEHYT